MKRRTINLVLCSSQTDKSGCLFRSLIRVCTYCHPRFLVPYHGSLYHWCDSTLVWIALMHPDCKSCRSVSLKCEMSLLFDGLKSGTNERRGENVMAKSSLTSAASARKKCRNWDINTNAESKRDLTEFIPGCKQQHTSRFVPTLTYAHQVISKASLMGI